MMKDNIFEGVLLASDYDATLTDSHGVIPAEVVAAVDSFMARGGRFSVSTGRTKQGYVAKDVIRCNAPVLLGNGVMAYDFDSGTTIYADAIGAEYRDFIGRTAGEFPEIGIEMYGTDFSTVLYRVNDDSVRHFANQFIEWKEISSFSQIPFPLVKVMISVRGRGQELAAWMADNCPPGLRYIWGYGDFLEIISSAAGKGRGLLRLADSLGIAHSRVYAVGDGYNDIDMLRAASIGFSPANSPEEVLRQTGVVVRDNDSGSVAHVIEILEMMYG